MQIKFKIDRNISNEKVARLSCLYAVDILRKMFHYIKIFSKAAYKLQSFCYTSSSNGAIELAYCHGLLCGGNSLFIPPYSQKPPAPGSTLMSSTPSNHTLYE